MVIILIVIVGLLLFRRRKARTLKAQPMPYEISTEPPFHHVQEYKPVQELGVQVPPAELPEMNHGGERWAELPGGR